MKKIACICKYICKLYFDYIFWQPGIQKFVSVKAAVLNFLPLIFQLVVSQELSFIPLTLAVITDEQMKLL